MKKILNEWNKYLKESLNLSERDLEYHRMMIAERLFQTIQKPSRQNAKFKQELPFLYYLYKGVVPIKDAKGNLKGYKISNEQNVGAVMNEIRKRAEAFVVSLDPPEDKIFAADALMIGYYMHMNKQRKAMGLASAYGVNAPGQFDTVMFGKARREVFQPFKKDLDFMLKSSPELANIPNEDKKLFEIETVISEILKILPRDPNTQIPQLSEDQFKANYLEGIPLKTWEKVQDQIVQDPTPDQQIGEATINSLNMMIKNLQDIQNGRIVGEEAIEGMRNVKTALMSETFMTPAVMEQPKYKELIGLAGLVGVWSS
tara:strand:+ start:2074 stop:3015 length:942 start_codon:yes stop_codon:yes gene_type:complete